MIDVARNIAADASVPYPAAVHDECPQPPASRIPLLAPQTLHARDQLAFVLDDAGALLDRARGKHTPAGNS